MTVSTTEAAEGRRNNALTTYYLLAAVTGLLLFLGLIMVLSASSVDSLRLNGSSFTVFQKQAIWFALGLPMLLVAVRMPVVFWRRIAYPLLGVSLFLLALVPLIGRSVGGNKNWLVFGGFSVQPSELAKLALVIWGADLLARKQKMGTLDEIKHYVVPLLPVGGLVVFLVLLGDDLGTSFVLMAIIFALLYFSGAPMRLFAVLGGLTVLMVAWIASTNPTRVERLTGFLDGGGGDALGTGYQVMQGKLALASGGFFGVGLGASRQKWGLLPQAQNDSIFAVIGEELGLVGTLVVLILFGALVFAGSRIAIRATDPFVRYASAAATTWIAVQTIVNIGAVIGVLPVIGLPLPLVSYGGSALLPTMVAVGMLLSFARSDPDAARALAARRERRREPVESGAATGRQ